MSTRASQERETARRHALYGLGLGALVFMVLLATASRVGYVRDEGIYFEASRHYGTWAALVVRDPGRAVAPKVRDELFRVNHEHPALMKLAAGVSANLLAEPPAPGTASQKRPIDRAAGGRWPVMREATAMRLPAMLLTALGVVMLFFAGARRGEGVLGGVLAGVGFVVLPRVFFHAHLHAFDVPVAVGVLAVWLVYQRSLDDPRFALLLGPTLGVAISIKHNALFMVPGLLLHYGLCLAVARWRGQRLHVGQCLPAPLVSIAVLTPLTVLALWPWLWSAPVERLGEYLAFHREHAYYNMEFWGRNYNEPPMPFAYPWVMTLATVPLGLLALAGLGGVLGVREDLTRPPASAELVGDATPTWIRPLPVGYPVLEEVGLLGLTLGPLLLIALPSVPIFGGTKHWLTAYPFMLLLAAGIYPRLWQQALRLEALEFLRRGSWRALPAVGLALVLLPGAWATYDGHPYNLSQYTPLVGGPRGAASLGLNRGFWGHAVGPLLDQPDAPGPLYLHDLHPLAKKQYEREGRWPAQWRTAPPDRAASALLFYEKHMLDDEVRIWNGMHTTTPRDLVTLDDVPLTAQY